MTSQTPETGPTPGPWWPVEVSPEAVNGNDDYYTIDWSADGERVSDGVYGKANANLIAAAPDLLEALKLQQDAELFTSNCTECEPEEDPATCGNCWPKFEAALLKRRAAIAKAEGLADSADTEGESNAKAD